MKVQKLFPSFVLITAILTAPSFAQRLSVHAHGGMAFPVEQNIEKGVGTGFGLSLQISDKLSICADFSHWNGHVEAEYGRFMNGDLVLNPVFFSIHYSFLAGKPFNPYLFIGPALVFARFKIGEYISIPELTISQTIDNGPGFHIGGGAAVRLTKKLEMFAEACYLTREARGKTILSDMNLGVSTETFSVSLGSLIARVGLKYYF